MQVIGKTFANENNPMKENERHWYIMMIAALYLVLCSISVVRYALMYFRSDSGTVSITVQLLCLGMALAAGTYFVKPRAGHKGLILFTVGTLVAISTTDPKATCFHLVILCLLLLPYIRRRARMNTGSEPGVAPNGGPAPQLGNSTVTEVSPSVS